MMKTTIKQLRKLFLLMCLITAGVQSAQADNWNWLFSSFEGAFYRHAGYAFVSLGETTWTKTYIEDMDVAHSGYTTIDGVKYYYYYAYVTIVFKAYESFVSGMSTRREYYTFGGAWVTDIEGNPDHPSYIIIPDHITVDGKDYPVHGMGYREYADEGNKKFKTSSSSITNSSLQAIVFGYDPDAHNQYEYVNDEGYNQAVGLYGGTISLPSVQIVEFQKMCVIKKNLNLPSVTSITFKDTPLFYTEGKITSAVLSDIYFKCTPPTWEGEYADRFSAPVNTITAHVYDMTPNEVEALKQTSPVWNGFKQIVIERGTFSYTLNSDGNAKVSLYKLNDSSSYASANTTLVESTDNGSKTGTVKGPMNYAVVISDFDPSIKTATLKRNGTPVELQRPTDGEGSVLYYDETSLDEDVTYEVSITDKTCEFSLTQTGYKGNITYTKTLNGTTSSGMIFNQTGSFTCGRGTTIQLSIPYDRYTPNQLELNGSYIVMNKANGRATATITVPAEETAAATLTWKAPDPLPEAHELPKVMVMRMGQGDVVVRDEFWTDDEQEMSNYRMDEPGWALRKTVNCEDAITTVTISDLDGYGHIMGEHQWGFVVEATPLAGQKVKTLLLCRVPHGSSVIDWEDVLTTNIIDPITGKCTIDLRGEYMSYGPDNYTVLVEMGPAESEVQTGQTFGFVRKGGRGDSWIFWEDQARDFYIEEGSSSKTIPNEQLTDVQMYVEVAEGETFHVYKNGVDITSQFQPNGPDDYWAELDTKSASYTLLIDDAPDANPTWNILQGEGMTGTQVIVTRGEEDETTTLTESATTMKINDEGVEKVTLKVPVGHVEPTIQYQVYATLQLVNTSYGTLVMRNIKEWLGFNTGDASEFVENGGGEIALYDTEDEALARYEALQTSLASNTTLSNPERVIITLEIRAINTGTHPVADSVPVRVIRNGVDITSQMNFDDPLYAVFEMPANTLTNATWEVSFDTSHRLTFVRTGGSLQSDIRYEIYHQEPTVDIPKGIVTFVDLPAYSDINGNLQLNIRVADNETFTVLRNGVDVTECFEDDVYEGYREWHIIGGNITDEQSIENWGFKMREAATWQIIIEDATFMVNAYATNDASVAIGGINSNGEVVNETSMNGQLHKQIDAGNGVKITFLPAAGDVLRSIMWGQFGNQEFTVGDGYLTKETINGKELYVITLPADYVTPQVKPIEVFAIFDKPDSLKYDLNNDGTVNIADVTTLVNKVLRNE